MSNQNKVPGCKVVLVGDAGVGKTCIISRFISGTFDSLTASTSGATYASKIIKFEKYKKQLSLDIWDTAGQEKYRSLTKFFYKDAMVVILVYDVTRKESFDNIKNYWYDQIQQFGEKEFILAIAGNKCDLYENEAVNEEEARAYAEEKNAIFQLTSASNNIGINELFYETGGKYLGQFIKPIENYEDKSSDSNNKGEYESNENNKNEINEKKDLIKLTNENNTTVKKKKCCGGGN